MATLPFTIPVRVKDGYFLIQDLYHSDYSHINYWYFSVVSNKVVWIEGWGTLRDNDFFEMNYKYYTSPQSRNHDGFYDKFNRSLEEFIRTTLVEALGMRSFEQPLPEPTNEDSYLFLDI